MKTVLFHIFLFWGISAPVSAQLNAFSLQLSHTNETCTNNAGISISVSNTTAGASMLYSLYLLPETDTPYAQFSATVLNGLSAGSYRLVAIQTLEGQSNSQQQDFTIEDQVVPLVFSVSTAPGALCQTTAGIVVTVNSGAPPLHFEITQGPVIYPQQSSNVFSGLSSGTYRVRVTDGCGTADVLDYVLVVPANNLVITPFSTQVTADCNNAQVISQVVPETGATITYPLTVNYLIEEPGGTQTTISMNVPSGDPDLLELDVIMPLYGDLNFFYSISIVDGCNNIFTSGGEVDPNPKPILTGMPNECGMEYLNLSLSETLPPYTLLFLQSPPGFNPSALNPAYPGPLNTAFMDFGDEDNTVPEGTYVIQVTDGCGRSGISEPYEYTLEAPEPVVTSGAENCNTGLGSIRVQIPEDRKVVSASIVAAPAAYVQPLPSNVSSFVNTAGILYVTGLPPGDYLLDFVDQCGHLYDDVPITIKDFLPGELKGTHRPSCTANFGSLRVNSPNGPITNLVLTAAPPAYGQTLPLDLTGQLISGVLLLNPLPPGDYSFAGTDACGVSSALTTTVEGYNPGTSNYDIERNCGSFNLIMHDNSNIVGSGYWLQYQDPLTGEWSYPVGGTPYPEETIPNSSNAQPMANLATLYNLTRLGSYRIIKIYQTFDDASTDCIEVYDPFLFTGNLDINAAYNLNCEGGSGVNDVLIDVVGVPPYLFSIIEKDEQPYVFDNGNSNIFTNLPSGSYLIEVQDNCGRVEQIVVNTLTLQPLVAANSPTPPQLTECAENGETTAVFDLTLLSASILGNQAASEYQVAFYHNLPDAQNQLNKIQTPEAYANTALTETIFVRVQNIHIDICYDTVSFPIFVGQTPVLDPQQEPVFVCDGGSVRIFADAGYGAYLWSTGATSSYIDVDTPGTYSVLVSNVYGLTGRCSAEKDIVVTGSGTAEIQSVDIVDWTDNANSLTVNVTGTGAYEYSLDGENYQESNVFTLLIPGIYTVYERDQNGCGVVTESAIVLGYPKFFTPNGDGYNENWQIKFAFTEPGMTVYIFDRYGKLLTYFGAQSSGWDGTYNGHNMPADDYWFLVERADGTTKKGHFTLKR